MNLPHNAKGGLPHRLATTPHLIRPMLPDERQSYPFRGHRTCAEWPEITVPEGRTQDSAGAGIPPLSVRPGADVSLSHEDVR